MFSKELFEGIDFKSFPVKPDDTIVVTVDKDIWNITDAEIIKNILDKVFPPTNTILVTLKGVDIDVDNKVEGQ